MEPFQANLAHYRLALVVPALCEKRDLTARLCLQRGALQREFYFRDGNLVFAVSNDPREHLAQVLFQLGMLDLNRSVSAFAASRERGVALGSWLVQQGMVDQQSLLEALSHKARESFFDCYAWESGELDLGWELPGKDLGVPLQIPLEGLHRDAVNRLREWRAFRAVFPFSDATFRVHRELGKEWRSAEEEQLLALAESGASLSELLTSAPEGTLFSARRILQLYRRGVLSPRSASGRYPGESVGPERMMVQARNLLDAGQFEAASAIAAQALECAPVPEASDLYREAELRMATAISDEVTALEGRMVFEPLPTPAPAHLTADDLYLYSLLKPCGSVREALRTAAMGELAAYRSVRRLVAAGLVRLGPRPSNAGPHTGEG